MTISRSEPRDRIFTWSHTGGSYGDFGSGPPPQFGLCLESQVDSIRQLYLNLILHFAELPYEGNEARYKQWDLV